jgi:hypothetical protein
MSEEKKEKRKPRIISRIALFAGIATLLCSFMTFPFAYFYSDALVSPDEPHDNFIAYFFLIVAYLSLFFLWPLFAISLILSIVTLFVERNERLRLLPLVLVLIGILPNAMFWFGCRS